MGQRIERGHRDVRTANPRPADGVLDRRAVLLFATALLAVPWPEANGAEMVVYQNGFESKPGSSFPGWASSRITYSSKFKPPGSGSVDAPGVTNVESPRGKRRFLGEFGGPRIDPTARTRVRQTVRLTLEKLPRHTETTVSCDLLVLKSWDGTSPRYGPDRFSLKVRGGPALIDTTFSNNPKLDSDQSFQDYPRPVSPPQAGAATVKTLGYGFFGDSVYHLSFTFPHAADSLVLEFASDLFEGKGTGDEAWGLDDVRVSVNTGGRTKATVEGRRSGLTSRHGSTGRST